MQLRFVRIYVKNQDAALMFYTEKLGFEKRADMMLGEYRFLTVAAPEGIEGVQLILEPADFPPIAQCIDACHDAGIPALSINTSNLQKEYRRLCDAGVVFVDCPQDCGPAATATFDDGCGNLVFLVENRHNPDQQTDAADGLTAAADL